MHRRRSVGHASALVVVGAMSVLIGGVQAQSADPAPSDGSTGRWIVFQTDIGAGNVIYVMRADGSGPRAFVPQVSGEQKHPDWSPTGDRVVFVANDDLWVADATGENAEMVLDCAQCDYPAWSPDGARVAFTEYAPGPNAPGASSIRILDVTSMAVTDVVREERPFLVDVPRWAPDGQRLVIGVDRMDDGGNETGATIGVVPVTGGTISYLRDLDTFAYYPDWSWTTDTIVFSTEALVYKASPGPGDDTWNLWTIRPDGSDVRQVTDVPTGTRLWQPSWTPDGRSVIADRHADRVGVLVDVATGQVDELAYQSSAVTHPRLQPIP